MTAPAEVQGAATESRDWDELAHYPTCGDGDLALCGVDISGSRLAGDADPVCVVCEEIDAALPGCSCPVGCSCCTPTPAFAVFDELHYFTGGAA